MQKTIKMLNATLTHNEIRLLVPVAEPFYGDEELEEPIFQIRSTVDGGDWIPLRITSRDWAGMYDDIKIELPVDAGIHAGEYEYQYFWPGLPCISSGLFTILPDDYSGKGVQYNDEGVEYKQYTEYLMHIS